MPQIVRFGAPPQQMRFPAQPRPQSGIQIGGGDNSQSMMQMLALLQFLSSQESQRASTKLERDMFELQKETVQRERQGGLRENLALETNIRLDDLKTQFARQQSKFERADIETAESGHKAIDPILRRAQELSRRLTRTGSKRALTAVENFMAEELPRTMASAVNSTDDPGRLRGMRAGLDEILTILVGTPDVPNPRASQTMAESAVVLSTDVFRDLYREYSEDRHAMRTAQAKSAATDEFNEYYDQAQQHTQAQLRSYDEAPPGTTRDEAFSELDRYRDLPENLFARKLPTGPPATGAPAAPLVSPGAATIGQTEGLIPQEFQERPFDALIAAGVVPAIQNFQFLFGSPGIKVGLPDPEAVEASIRAEQEATGLSNPENTAADPTRAAPVRLIEPQGQGPASLDDLLRMMDAQQFIRRPEPVGPFGPQG